jgi:uncharacterized protein YuzE
MKLHYDEQTDALYFRLDESKVVDSQEVEPGVVLDYNARDEIVAIEILGLKRRFPSADPKHLQLETS